MKKAFAGELTKDWREKHPELITGENSAERLLEKIKAEKDQRISLRDRIFREVAANMLIHREFLNPYPAKFIIETHRLFAENSNKPHGHGLIDPANFSPFPKNPVIARFFKEIGRADELGSGVRKLFKYCRHYSGGKTPELIEGDIFKSIIPSYTSYPASHRASGHASYSASHRASHPASHLAR